MDQDDDNTSHSPVRRSYVIAAMILLLLAAWVASGEVNRISELTAMLTGSETGKKTSTTTTTPPPEKPDARKPQQTKAPEKPTVRVKTMTAVMRQQDIVVRGLTQALRKVLVRAETAGKVAKIRADKGTVVKAGDTICELNVDARLAMLKEARATMKQKQLEYEASVKLQEKGFRSPTAVAADLAEYEAAKALVERMEKEFENTRIKAPFDGVVDDRLVDVGDYLAPGQPCALVVALDPFLVVGRVSEREVPFIKIGDTGWAKLVTGERVEGKVRFVAASSDAATRTFRVELEFRNANGAIRDGITAEIHIAAATVEAHLISPAILSLDAKGEIGVRIVDQQRRVRFVRVKIVGDDPNGVWVTGLPRTVTIITVGQEYVNEGQEVTIAPDNGSQT